MSALGQKRTYAVQKTMSASPPIATEIPDIAGSRWSLERFCSAQVLADLLRYSEEQVMEFQFVEPPSTPVTRLPSTNAIGSRRFRFTVRSNTSKRL